MNSTMVSSKAIEILMDISVKYILYICAELMSDTQHLVATSCLGQLKCEYITFNDTIYTHRRSFI